MMKPLQKFNCISCNRPLQVESQHPAPALPLLSAVKDPTKQHPHVANGSGARLQRTKSAQLQSLFVLGRVGCSEQRPQTKTANTSASPFPSLLSLLPSP